MNSNMPRRTYNCWGKSVHNRILRRPPSRLNYDPRKTAGRYAGCGEQGAVALIK